MRESPSLFVKSFLLLFFSFFALASRHFIRYNPTRFEVRGVADLGDVWLALGIKLPRSDDQSFGTVSGYLCDQVYYRSAVECMLRLGFELHLCAYFFVIHERPFGCAFAVLPLSSQST